MKDNMEKCTIEDNKTTKNKKVMKNMKQNSGAHYSVENLNPNP